MRLEKFIGGCDKAIVCWTCGLIYFLPISTGLTEWGGGLLVVTFFVKRTAVFLDRNRRAPGGQPKVPVVGAVLSYLKTCRPAGWYLNKPLALFVFVNFLSILISHDYLLSIKGFVFKLLEGVYVYFGVMEGIKTRKQIKVILWIFLISSFLVGLSGLFQLWTGTDFLQGRSLLDDGRIRSSLKHANDLGGYIITVFPLVLSMILLWFFPRVRRKGEGTVPARTGAGIRRLFFQGALLSVIITVLFVCLGLTFSRGAWFGFFSGMALIGLARPKTLLPVSLIVLLFCVIFFPRMNTIRHISLGETEVAAPLPVVTRAEEGFIDKLFLKCEKIFGSGMGRVGYWREALSIIRDYPVLGVGLNTYSKIGEHYKINWGGYPHNCYLHMTAETGLLGLGSFIWILTVLFRRSLKNLRLVRDAFGQSALLGLTAGLAGFFVHSFFDTNFYSVQLGVLFWLIIGLTVKIQDVELRKP